jgi:hypothetical protein
MTRIGINPARGKYSGYRPARVTVAVITCIPHLEGYFQGKLEVLRLSLASLLAYTTLPYDLLVFDNGSCAQVVDYLRGLQESGALRYLFLSGGNIGKIGAFQLIFPSAPGEIIAYSDDDILFYPAWLEAHLRLLEGFPRAGMISGVPVRNGSRYAVEAIRRLQQENLPGLEITPERRIPDEWEADWALSTGRDPEASREALKDQVELVLRKEGLEAIGTANHFQFVAPKQVLLEALPDEWSGRLMGQMIELDEAIDAAGYLRLSTVERYTRHIGNLISPALQEAARRLGLEAGRAQLMARRKRGLGRIPAVRRILLALYNRMFKILNEVD